jgi:hypothetical protein
MLELLKVNLTDIQKQHIDSLLWLLADRPEDRRTGRTYLLALVYIASAIKYPGRTIFIRDHAATQQDDWMLQFTIKNMVDGLPKEMREDFVFMDRSFCYRKIKANP